MRIPMPCNIYAEKLFNVLMTSIEKYRCDCIALSGGIDTSLILLANISAGYKPRGYTAVYRQGLPKDLVYVNHIAKLFNIDVKYIYIDQGDIDNLMSGVIGCIGRDRIDSHRDGGCIEIRNDIVFYSILREAKRDGCRCIYTGSGGDEVFAGYSFLLKLVEKELEETINRLAYGRYPELEIAKCIDVKAVALLLDREVLDTAFKIPINCLRSEKMQGKEVLREILRSRDLHVISQRIKTPAEDGAGTVSICRSIYDY
ncbi:MAG: asparagine synthase-related protein [Ignisphaera sp.]